MPIPFRAKAPTSKIDAIEELALLAARSEGAQQETAFAQLYEALYTVVVRDIRWRVKDLPTAEDLAQDVWIKAARSITSYEGRGGGFVSWLLTIARNLVISHNRNLGRRAQETLSADMWMLSLMPSNDISPEEAAEHADLADRIGACIGRLSPTMQEVLRLRIFAGLSYEETAAVIGKSVNVVKVAQHRALRKLAAIMPERDSRMAEYVYAGHPVMEETVPVVAVARG